jgi:hypothetical protein
LSRTTGITPFFTNNGYHPGLNFDIMEQNLLENHDAQEYATKLQEIYPLIQVGMHFTPAKQQESWDPYRNPAPADQVGDVV